MYSLINLKSKLLDMDREREREGGRENGTEEERSVIVCVLVGLRCREGGSVRENQIGDRLIQNFLYLDLGCL